MNNVKNDVLENSVKQIHTHLLKQYYQKTVETEMALYIARQTRMDNKVQRYFNSSPLRNGFARWMTYGVYANRFYTITELVDEMFSNRQSISTMVNECEAEGWLEVTRKANLVKCRASALLVEKMEDYCMWRKDNTRSIIGTAYNALYNFEDLMQMELPLELK